MKVDETKWNRGNEAGEKHKGIAIMDNTKIQEAKITQQISGDSENHKIPELALARTRET
jgi:hypothetical protein